MLVPMLMRPDLYTGHLHRWFWRGGQSTRGRRMDFRDSLAMHPARLRSAYATKLRAPDSHALTPALRSPEVVDIRDSLAMHPARFPLQNKRRPRAKAA